MKLCTFRAGGEPRLGVSTARGIVDVHAADPTLAATSVAELLALGADALARAESIAQRASDEHVRAREGVTLLPPVPNPAKIICVGLNYRDHAAEVKLDLPQHVTIFAKWPNTLIGDGAPIVIPPESHRVDFEA